MHDILIVDDDSTTTELLNLILKDEEYTTRCTNCPKEVFELIKEKVPSLIITDVSMPEIDGFTICERLYSTEKYKDIPLIFMSAMKETQDVVKGFSLGAVDYITKPLKAEEVKIRIKTHLKICDLQIELKKSNERLQKKVAKQVKEIANSQIQTIFSLAKLAQSRDDDTGEHLERVRKFCSALAENLSIDSPYSDVIDEAFIINIKNASPLHDIGKVGISDLILLKPGKLTEEEFEIMKTHVIIGAETLETVQSNYNHNEFINMGALIARHHHERWDGKGYPDGLSGEEIPLAARIMAIADVYDALRTKRSYKDSFSHEKSKAIILEGKGTQFDPVIVEAFEKINEKFDLIWQESQVAQRLDPV